jgi:hypothetical protein
MTVRPQLMRCSLSKFAKSTSVSIPYASDIRNGKRGPHPRHWQALAGLVGVSNSRSAAPRALELTGGLVGLSGATTGSIRPSTGTQIQERGEQYLTTKAPSRPHDDIVAILPSRYRNTLSEAERRLLRATSEGEVACCGGSMSDENNDPAHADRWHRDREIRADLVRWICITEEASKKVDPHGVQAYGAKVIGTLDLSFAKVPFPIRLVRCRVAAELNLGHSKIRGLDLGGTSAMSVSLEGAEVAGDVMLREFTCRGEVRLLGTRIDGILDCSGCILRNPNDKVLSADEAEIRGGVFLFDVSTDGEVRLPGAHIGGNLECDRASFKNTGGKALDADGADIRGSVFLRNNFSADGQLTLIGTRIGGALDCSQGRFGAVHFYTTSVRGTFAWKEVRGVTLLNLRDAAVGVMWDDEESWPQAGGLFLDGFVYGNIVDGPTDALLRLEWLNRQGEFKPQPYRQLAKVLRELGDDDGAKQVLYELEDRVRARDRRLLLHAPARLLRFTEDSLSDVTVGYGIYPGRVIWYVASLTILGWIIHRRAQNAGRMVPTDKDAYTEFRASGHAPGHYPRFSPFVYSLENCLPLVKLGQDDRWQADPSADPVMSSTHTDAGFGRLRNLLSVRIPNLAISPVFLRWFRWIMIGLGWILATFFVAAVTGIIKAS